MACVYYSKIPIYPIFFLLKGDYIYRVPITGLVKGDTTVQV